MRRTRFKAEGEGFYHVVSRIGGRRFLIDDEEKHILLGMVRAAAEFSGVEIYTYALMDNHFHLLIRVPGRQEVDDTELERRLKSLYGPKRSATLLGQWAKWMENGNGSRVEDAKQCLRARMFDLSQFVKTFKEAYTQDYNRRHDNTGTIWEGRFKSMLLEGSSRALMAVAAYIHLNPVRAKMVENPALAYFTGYGAACNGDGNAQRALLSLITRVWNAPASGWNWGAVRQIFHIAMEGILETPSGTPNATKLHPPQKKAPENEPGPHEEPCLLRDLLHRRCLGFLHGGALGSAAFLRMQTPPQPPHLRQRPPNMLDRCRELGLTVLLGIRKVS